MQQEQIPWVAVAVVLVGLAFASVRRRTPEAFDAVGFLNPKHMSIVVNLDRNQERLLRILAEYSRSDLNEVPVRRLPAVDAAKIDLARYVTEKTMAQIQMTDITGYRVRHHEMTGGAVGCFLSHISAMRMLLQDDKHDVYLILEDDALIPEVIYDDVKRIMTTAPAKWDMISLGSHYATFHAEQPHRHLKRLLSFWGTHAYIINKQGAQKIVKEYQKKKISMQIDSMMSVMASHDMLNVYTTHGNLIQSGQFGSDIQVPVKVVDGIDPYDLEGFSATKTSF